MAQAPYNNSWLPQEQNYQIQQAPSGDPNQQPPEQQQQAQTAGFDPSKAPSSVPTGWAEDFIRRNPGDYHRISEAYASERGGGGGGESSSSSSAQTGGFGDWYKGWFEQQRAQAAAQDAERKQKADNLYNTWLGRSQQALNIDRNDPIIRAQADAYRANEDRSSRNYLSDLAESAGPLANLRGEQRMASERVGQRTGAFEAELLGRELTTRRNEIAQALSAMGGMLSADQQVGLQRELAILDQAIRERGLALQSQSLDQDWQRALLQNNQFMADLGLRAENQYNFWNDPLRGIS